MFLKDKKILFVGIGFYDYEDIIKRTLSSYGAEVTYFSSVQTNVLARILNKLKLHAWALCIQQSLKRKNIESKKGNNIIFIVKGQNLQQSDIDLMRLYNPHAKFIIYLWDSLVRHENRELLLNNFDNIWSFDREDCIKNNKLKFRPLFFRTISHLREAKYTMSFIGWMHSDRLHILKEIRKQLKKRGETYCFKLYLSKVEYIYNRYFCHSLKKEDEEFIITNPLKYSDVQDIMNASKTVLDIAHPLQSGLTMRTIESLAAGCFLITTNPDIRNYKEIDINSYYVMDRKELKLPHFSKIGYYKQNNTFFKYYSIEGFIEEIFNTGI